MFVLYLKKYFIFVHVAKDEIDDPELTQSDHHRVKRSGVLLQSMHPVLRNSS